MHKFHCKFIFINFWTPAKHINPTQSTCSWRNSFTRVLTNFPVLIIILFLDRALVEHHAWWTHAIYVNFKCSIFPRCILNMNSKDSLHAATFLTLFCIFTLFSLVLVAGSMHNLHAARLLHVTGAAGPESLVFDSNGEGPYTGVADGRILKWEGKERGWTEFAVTSSNR